MLKLSRSDLAITLLAFLVAIAVTAYSSNIQRFGPELGVYGNLCGPSGNELCYEPILNGGLPIPYFFDNPGISVRGTLDFFEDEFRVLPFLIDVILIGAILSAVFFAGRGYLRRKITS